LIDGDSAYPALPTPQELQQLPHPKPQILKDSARTPTYTSNPAPTSPYTTPKPRILNPGEGRGMLSEETLQGYLAQKKTPTTL